MNQTSRIHAIDIMRVTSILGVVLIHTTTKILETGGYNLNTLWLTLFLNQVSRFAVPLFIIISGYLLEVSYRENDGLIFFLKKRLYKIIVPFIFWSLIYYFFIYTNNTNNFLYVLITGSASYQLYFIPTIFLFYILFPLIKILEKYVLNPFSLTILGTVQLLLMYHDYYLKQFGYTDPVRIFLLSYFFFLSGILIAKNKDLVIRLVNKYILIFIIVIIFLADHIYTEGFNRYYKTFNIGSFYSQWRPSVMFYSLFLSGVLLSSFIKLNIKVNIIERLSNLSFFVFFVHVVVLETIWKKFSFVLFPITKNGFLSQFIANLILFLSVVFISFVLAFCVHKFKKVIKITG